MTWYKYSILFICLCFSSINSHGEEFQNSFASQNKTWVQRRNEFTIKNKNYLSQIYSQINHIIGIELIIVGPIDQNPESQFGHALLRFVSDSNNPTNDIILSFLAYVDDPKFNYLKGIGGVYPTDAYLAPFSEIIRSYIEQQERPLERYIIPTDKKLRLNLIENLAKWINFPQEMGSYKFFSNNCAGVLLELLKQSGFPTAIKIPIPSMLPIILSDRYITPYDKLTIPTLASVFNSLSLVMKVPEQDLRNRNWPLDTFKYLQKLPPETVAQLWFKDAPIESEIRSQFLAIMSQHTDLNLSRVYHIKDFPREMYELCDNKLCANNLTSAIAHSNIYDNNPNYIIKVSEKVRLKINESIPWLSDIQRRFVLHSLLMQK